MNKRNQLISLMVLLLILPVMIAAQDEAAGITLEPQTLTFTHSPDDITLTFGIPVGWFITADEFGFDYHLSNTETYARRLSPMWAIFREGEQYMRLKVISTDIIRGDLENPSAVDLFFRFGISESGTPEAFDAGDGRDMAIIENVRLFNGYGVAVLEQRGDILIQVLALAPEEDAAFIRALALRVLDSTLPDSTQGETNDNTGQGGIHMDVNFPAWVADYPNIDATINAYLNDALRDYMQTMIDNNYDLVTIPRPLVFEVTYKEVIYSDDIVTIVFTIYADYGGVYPVDWLNTFTFVLSADRRLEITDLLHADASVPDVLLPFVEEQLADLSADFLDGESLQDPATYNTFTLTSEALTLLYPTGRIGPAHAGSSPVVIPLEAITTDLNPAVFED